MPFLGDLLDFPFLFLLKFGLGLQPVVEFGIALSSALQVDFVGPPPDPLFQGKGFSVGFGCWCCRRSSSHTPPPAQR